MTRLIVSVVPPGGKGTMSRIGLEGNAWASAASPHVAAQIETAKASVRAISRSHCGVAGLGATASELDARLCEINFIRMRILAGMTCPRQSVAKPAGNAPRTKADAESSTVMR